LGEKSNASLRRRGAPEPDRNISLPAGRPAWFRGYGGKSFLVAKGCGFLLNFKTRQKWVIHIIQKEAKRWKREYLFF
jgi:hypothetical protein